MVDESDIRKKADLEGLVGGAIVLCLVALGIFWVWYSSSYETVPDVVGQTVDEAQQTIDTAGYGRHGDTRLEDFMSCDFSGIDGPNSGDCVPYAFSSNDDLDTTQLVVVKQDPTPGRYRIKNTKRLTVTVKPTKEYGRTLEAEYQKAQEEEQQKQKELNEYRKQEADDDAARELNDRIEPCNDPLVSDKLPTITGTGYQVVYVDSPFSGNLEEMASGNDVTKDVLGNPGGWYITDSIQDADSASRKVWIAVAAVSSKQADDTTGTSSSSPEPQGKSYYRNCKDVWNTLGHGITSNDPGYRPELDADDDGYACEIRPNY